MRCKSSIQLYDRSPDNVIVAKQWLYVPVYVQTDNTITFTKKGKEII